MCVSTCVYANTLCSLRWIWIRPYELNQQLRRLSTRTQRHTQAGQDRTGKVKESLTLKLWTFSYLGAKSLSLRVARRTSDVSCERAKDLIGCQKVEAGEVGLEGPVARFKQIPDPVLGSDELLGTGREGTEPVLAFKPRAAVNKKPFWPVSFSARLRNSFLPLLTMYDSRLGIMRPVVLKWRFKSKAGSEIKPKSKK